MPGDSGPLSDAQRRRPYRDPPTDPDFQIPVLPPPPEPAPPPRRPVDDAPYPAPARSPLRWARPAASLFRSNTGDPDVEAPDRPPNYRPPPPRLSLTPAALRERVRRHSARRRWRYVLAGRSLAATVAAAVFAATGLGWGVVTWANDKFRQISALDPESGDIRDAAGQRGDENFLLVGSDTRAGAQAEDQSGTQAQVGGARSDTVMIAHLPADRSRAVIVSFPRDLEIDRPACQLWDPATGAYPGGLDLGAKGVKLNTAYEIGGPRCVTRVVQQLSGLLINHFVGVDFQGFKSMVDAVNGVQVCVERPVDDAELGMIIPRPGLNVIDGETALRFVRARNVAGDPTGDYGRIVRQQRFLSALLRKTMSNAVLFNPDRLRALVQAVAANTFGQNADVVTLLELARSLDGLDPADVTFVTVPTSGEANGRGNEELQVADSAALFRAIINGTPLLGETVPGPFAPAPLVAPGGAAAGAAPAPAPPPLRSPEQVLVRVRAGEGNRLLGTSTASGLRTVGFGVFGVTYVGRPVTQTAIRYAPGLEADARTVNSAVPTAALVPDPDLVGSVVLDVGPDVGTVLPPGLIPPVPPELSTVNAADATCA